MQLLYMLVVKSLGTSGVRAQAPHDTFGAIAIAARAGSAIRSHLGRRLDAAQIAVITAPASAAKTISRTGIACLKNGLAASQAPG